MDNKLLLKKGSVLGTTAHYEHLGQIVELSPDCISVQLDSPITLIFSREIPTESKSNAYAVEIEGEYYATQEGFDTALDLMLGLSTEEETMLDQPDRLADVIKEFRERINEDTSVSDKNRILVEIQTKHFPELKETVFTARLIDEFYTYLKEVEGWDDIDLI